MFLEPVSLEKWNTHHFFFKELTNSSANVFATILCGKATMDCYAPPLRLSPARKAVASGHILPHVGQFTRGVRGNFFHYHKGGKFNYYYYYYLIIILSI